MGKQLPRIAILALPEATASVVYGMLDLFCSAGRDWKLITDGEPGAQVVDARIVAQCTDPFEVANGAVVRPHAERCRRSSTTSCACRSTTAAREGLPRTWQQVSPSSAIRRGY